MDSSTRLSDEERDTVQEVADQMRQYSESEDLVQLLVRIPRQLKIDFKMLCMSRGVPMDKVVRRLLSHVTRGVIKASVELMLVDNRLKPNAGKAPVKCDRFGVPIDDEVKDDEQVKDESVQ